MHRQAMLIEEICVYEGDMCDVHSCRRNHLTRMPLRGSSSFHAICCRPEPIRFGLCRALHMDSSLKTLTPVTTDRPLTPFTNLLMGGRAMSVLCKSLLCRCAIFFCDKRAEGNGGYPRDMVILFGTANSPVHILLMPELKRPALTVP